MKEYLIFTDGGARGNPGPAAAAFLVYLLEGEKVFSESFFLGNTTNNVAEYQAVVRALKWLVKNCNKEGASYSFYLDSQLVVNQLSGLYRVKDSKLQKLIMTAKEEEKKLRGKVIFCYLPREFNRMADRLVNRRLDELK